MGTVEGWNRDEIEDGEDQVDEYAEPCRPNQKAKRRSPQRKDALKLDENHDQERKGDRQHQIRDDPSERNPDVSAPEVPELPGIDRDRFGPPKNQAARHEIQDHRNNKRSDRIQM